MLIYAGRAHSPGSDEYSGFYLDSEAIPKVSIDEDTEDGLCDVTVDAPMPYLRCGTPLRDFQALRDLVIKGAGFDFLSRCGDLMRPKNARSDKSGVAFHSRHKHGEAFDYNQEDPRILLVREQREGLTFWRTYLLCEKQDGTLGTKTVLNTDNVGTVSAYVFDFTAVAEGLGWYRIAAKRGWGAEPSNKEFWHYERHEPSSDPAINANNGVPLSAISTAEFSRWESNTKSAR